MDLTAMDDPAAALAQINADLLGVHRNLLAQDRRPPALMVTCESSHPEIGAFIGAKHDADFASWVTNISVRVRDDASWPALRAQLAANAHHNGEPGVLFQEEADRDNPTPDIEMVSTAPCAEVFLSPGERCVFMTVNLAAHVHDRGFDWVAFRRSVALAVRAGDAAVELAAIDASPIVADRRRIGVGVCGFHTALIMMRIPYADGGAFARSLAEDLTFTAHSASVDLAEARGPFPIWHGSRWRDPSWLRRKADRRSGAIADDAWEELHQRQLHVGIRNAAVVAYPPTGVIAAVLGVSRSYEPHFTLVGRTGVASQAEATIVPEALHLLRNLPDGDRVLGLLLDPTSGHQVPDADADDVLACARQLPPSVHLDVHAAFSGLADESGSKTVNLPATATVADVEDLLERARTLGLKGITVFREGCLDAAGSTA
jgi:ribonucleoside-diphosphate reductase alpha chain